MIAIFVILLGFDVYLHRKTTTKGEANGKKQTDIITSESDC